MKKKERDMEHTQIQEIRPSITADKNSQKRKKHDPKRTKSSKYGT